MRPKLLQDIICRLKFSQFASIRTEDIKGTIGKIMMSKTHPAIAAISKVSPPRSAPSMIPKRVKSKKQVRHCTTSEPVIVKLNCAGDTGDNGFLTFADSKSFTGSQAETNFTSNCSNFLSEFDSTDGCKKKTRTVGTSYSEKDFGK